MLWLNWSEFGTILTTDSAYLNMGQPTKLLGPLNECFRLGRGRQNSAKIMQNKRRRLPGNKSQPCFRLARLAVLGGDNPIPMGDPGVGQKCSCAGCLNPQHC
jgi:hypothetical protein